MPDLGESGAAIDLVGLSKSFGDSRAVDCVDLAVEAGEFMTFLGPSGSGKTTTLNMIAGFVTPDAGDISIGGKSVLRVPTYKRNMGMVFQGYALFPHMTVADNVAFPLKQRKTPRAERSALVDAALSTVELTAFAHRRPAELSGGQQQRVALARAIVYRPPVMLMDEPLGALDKKLRENLQEEIREIHRELGTTFVYVTHDQEEALSLSDRIAVYDKGGIAQVGTGEELYERPRTLFVAQFLGESTLIRGRIEGGDRGTLASAVGRFQIDNRQGIVGEATLMVRPERLRLRRVDEVQSSGPSGEPRATLVSEVYLGHTRKLTIRFADGGFGTVKEGPGESSRASTGDEVLVGWEQGAPVLLPDNLAVENQATVDAAQA